jgi:hypothetical protein
VLLRELPWASLAEEIAPGLFDLVYAAVAGEDPAALERLEKVLEQQPAERTAVR